MTRSRSPALRTLPSSRVLTWSLRPISRVSREVPRKRKEDVREATRSPSMRLRAAITSSAMPSQKYSWSFSWLMSANGSTATEGPKLRTCSAPSRRRSSRPALRSTLDWRRLRGSFSRQRSTTLANPGGRSARTAAGRGRGVAEDRGDELRRRSSAERPVPGRHLEQDDAEREDVGARVEAAALDLLRGHVGQGSQEQPGPILGPGGDGGHVGARVAPGARAGRGRSPAPSPVRCRSP